jgi:PhnB protein
MKAQMAGAISGKETTMTTLSSYLLFDGNCRQAMEFYRSCLGGELILTLVKDTPAKQRMPESQHNKVLNARLQGSNVDISASDWLRPDRTPIRGNTACLYLSGGTFQELTSLFERLSEGGESTDPLNQQFFGAYGALNDQFGVRWMFHTNSK